MEIGKAAHAIFANVIYNAITKQLLSSADKDKITEPK